MRDTVRRRGWLGAIRDYGVGLVEFLRDLTPARRKSRYGDIDYDFDHGVDTTWATVSLRTRWRELLSGGQYQPTEPRIFREILDSLPFALDGLTFVDVGCGKGRTLLMAAEYPFQRIQGVELLDELTSIARSNVERYSSPTQKCFNIEAVTADARSYAFPPQRTLLYLFDPFPEAVLRTVLHNLKTSARCETYVIYHNLVHLELFREQAWLQELARTPQYAIYSAKPDILRAEQSTKAI